MGEDSVIHRFFATLERGLSWIDSLTKAVGVGILVALLALNFDAIASGLRGFAEKLPQLVKVSAFGVNVELDPAAIEANVKSGAAATNWLKNNWGADETRNAVEGLRELDQRELTRLVDLGKPLLGQCRYAKSNVDQLYEYATDKSLAAKGLATLRDDSALLAQKQDEAAKGGLPNGAPIECYDIELAKPGLDVRTAIVRSLGSAIDAVRPTTAATKPPAVVAPAPRAPAAKGKP